MLSKEKYTVFCEFEKQIPIFSQPWWLDAVCGEKNWDVILIEKNDQIIASFPYFYFHSTGMNYIGMPPLTQKLGMYINYPDGQTESSRLSYEKEILDGIISKLPYYDFFSVQFDYRYQNWLPFYWNGFEQTTRYTYVIEQIIDIECVYKNFDHSKRKNIKKAQNEVVVLFDLSCVDFYENHKMTLLKQGEKISYSYDVFQRIYVNAYKYKQGRTIYCRDKDGHIHAALFVVWDNGSAYDLISTIDPNFRNSGAATLLVYEMIKTLSGTVKSFDFEGSMIEGVENSFRKFGSVQKSYFQVFKANSRRYKFLKSVKDFWNAVKD